MIWLPQLRRKAPLVPEVREEPPLSAEVFVGPNLLHVTFPLTQISDGDVDVVVTRSSIRVRSKSNPKGPTFLIPLPVEVEPGRYVLRHHNGLLDFTLERTSH